MTYICMAIVVLFMAYIVLYKAKIYDDNMSFFDRDSSSAMRGLWCLVVIFVHVPKLYQNPIQDMISSFGYIGVTFFFMTSGYGLKYSFNKKNDSIKHFWRKRLPKLLLPMLLVNAITILINFIIGKSIYWFSIFNIDWWVVWLLFCYFVFWLCYRIPLFRDYKDYVIASIIICFSLINFFFGAYIDKTTWCTEIYGFIWGMILYDLKEYFKNRALTGWVRKAVAFFAASVILGVAYLKYKPVYFWGDYILKIVLGAIILLFVMHLMVRVSIGNKASLFIGTISYEIYLLHGRGFDLIEHFLPFVDSGLFIILSIGVTVALAILTHKVFVHNESIY